MNTDTHTTTYFITGATGCLGSALALEAAQLNTADNKIQLILHGRNQQALAVLDDEIQSHGSIHTLLWPLDFLTASELFISNAIEELMRHIDSIDAIFHCAVASGQQVPILHETHEAWQNVIQTNIEIPRLLIKHLFPFLQVAPSAHIVFFDDIEPHHFYQGAFTMSKIMLHHLVNQLNAEFENINQVYSVILKLQPLYSPLRAKRFPGENPEIHVKAHTTAQDILSKIEKLRIK